MSKFSAKQLHELHLHGLEEMSKAAFTRLMTSQMSVHLGVTHGILPLADTVIEDHLQTVNMTFAEHRKAVVKSNSHLVFTGGSHLYLAGDHNSVFKYKDMPVYVAVELSRDGERYLSTYYYVDMA